MDCVVIVSPQVSMCTMISLVKHFNYELFAKEIENWYKAQRHNILNKKKPYINSQNKYACINQAHKWTLSIMHNHKDKTLLQKKSH